MRPNLIKSLQTAFPRGAPFDHQELTKLGVSSALAHHYLKSGWLVRLGRGVFMFPNDTLRREDCLKFLSGRVPGFHVGGKTALAWRGIRHNIPAREQLSLWGEGKTRLPDWFQELSLAPHGAKPIFHTAEELRFAAAAGNAGRCSRVRAGKGVAGNVERSRSSPGNRGSPQYHGGRKVAATGGVGNAA